MHPLCHHATATTFDLENIIGILIGIVALVLAVVSIFVARANHQRNEKFLRYSFWLDRKHREARVPENIEGLTKKQKDIYRRQIEEVILIRKMFSLDFPDPTVGIDFDNFFCGKKKT